MLSEGGSAGCQQQPLIRGDAALSSRTPIGCSTAGPRPPANPGDGGRLRGPILPAHPRQPGHPSLCHEGGDQQGPNDFTPP